MTKTSNKLGAAIIVGVFAVTVQASDSYVDFTAGNPDIVGDRSELRKVTAMPPTVGSDVDRYHGIADGNGDLLFDLSGADRDSGEAPRIYNEFGGNPDLEF
ncbi:MAG: hypothetical protein WBG92_10300 [Thiohalocapsa sp.]